MPAEKTYSRLTDYLTNCDFEHIKLTFAELERIIGRPLPNSARTYNAWWNPSGHSHCQSWINAGYSASQVSLTDETVIFNKRSAAVKLERKAKEKPCETKQSANVPQPKRKEPITVCGYNFQHIQRLCPECGSNGEIKKFYPQAQYLNSYHRPLLPSGDGAFCRFFIDADEIPGVYLWVSDGEVIYIGETSQLRRRFNTGYGNISPRNCYLGGQSTNCKMNKVVLKLYESGKLIDLYFYRTDDYKQVELELLNKIRTRYNVKNN